jgi:hypothetical protein
MALLPPPSRAAPEMLGSPQLSPPPPQQPRSTTFAINRFPQTMVAKVGSSRNRAP